MKKFVSLLTAVMLTIQTLSSATSIVQAAESPQSTTSAEIAAALQDLGLTALLDQIADYGGVFDASTFTLADIQGLEDLVNALVSEYSAELTDALDEVINDLLSQLGGGDAGAGEQLTAALQSIFATTLTELQSLNTTELRAHIEEKIQEIAPKIISGELSAVEAKAEVSKEIEKTMETLADKVYIYAYNEIKSQTLASLGNDSQALLDLLGQQNLNSEDLSTALNALSALAAFNANKETLKAELIAALQAQDKDCSDSTLFPTETEQNACQDAKNAYQTVQNQIDTASGAVNAAAAIVKSTSIALSCVKGEKDENNKVVGGTYTGEPCPTDNNALTTALDTIDATAAGIKAGLDGLETLLGISEDDDFDTKKTEAAQEVTILQAEINQIKASDEYKKLQEELVALEVEKAKIISENADLQAKIEALDTQITNLQQEIDTINAGGKVCRNIVGNKCSDENKCGFFSNSSCKDTVKIAVQWEKATKEVEKALISLGSTANIDWQIVAKNAEIAAKTFEKEIALGLAETRAALFTDENKKSWEEAKEKLNPASEQYFAKSFYTAFETALSEAQTALSQAQSDLSDAKAGLTDASKTVEDKAGLILTSLASAYGIFDDLNNALNAEIQKAKETLADAIAQAAALGVKEAFTTIAQPIASQVQYFSNEAIDLIFNAIDQARDFAQDTALPALEQAAQALTDGLANAQKEIETLKTEAQKLSNQIETLLNVLTDNPNLAFVTDYLKDLQERKKLVETELANLEKAYQTVQDNIEEIKKTLTQIKADESTLQQNGQFTVENLKEWIEDIADLFTLIAQQAADLQDLLKTSAEVAENLHNLNKDFVNDIGDEVNRLANLAKEQIDEAIKNWLTDLDEIINQAKGTINAIVDEIIAHFPAIKNQLKKAVEEAFQDITDYAKNQWEQALEKAVKDLEDTLHSLIENLTEEIEKAVSPEDIAKLHTSLEGVSATLKATAEALIKKLPDAKGKIENLLQTTQKKIEEALKAKLDELGQVADEKLRELYRDSIGFLNGNALVAPTFTGNEAAPYCSTEKTYVFSTTGSKVLSGEVYGNDVEDVIGYLAILTDDEGKQQLFILPGSELKDFPIAINEAIKDYTLEIRTIGKDNILPVASATIYEKIKNLNLEQDWTALVADVKEGITDIQSILAKIETRLHDSDSKLLEKLQPIRTFLTEVASKVINSVPAEWSAPVIEALQTAQDGIEALPAALAVHLKVADALNQQFFDKAYEQWAPIDDNILHVSDGSVATFITTLQKIDKQEDFDERGVLPYKIGFSRWEFLSSVVNAPANYTVKKVEVPVATGYTVTGKVGDTFSNPLSGMTNVEITTGQWEEAYTTTGTYTIEYVVFNEVITGCEASKIYSKTETITISVEAETPATGGNSGSSSGGSYYGGGGWGGYYTQPTEEETTLAGEVTEETLTTSTTKCSTEGSTYSDEENAAYLRACENDITTMRTIQEARLHDRLTRAETAKLISQYAINIRGKQANTTKDCSNFQKSIESYKGSDLYDFMTTSCQLDIMGINPDRSAIPDFMGEYFLQRKDFGTVFSRLLWGEANESMNTGDNYWDGHLQALLKQGIITNRDASLFEVRSRVFLQLYRSTAKK